MSLLIAVLILIQDPVPGLLAKIDGKDPEACFRAIADLADLGPAHRAEIEKGAARVPAFYRDALLEELKRPSPGRKRITLEGSRTIRGHLEELEQRSDLRFDLTIWSPKMTKADDPLVRDRVELACRDVTAMDALAALCAAESLIVEKDALSDKLELTNIGGPAIRTQGQRSALILHKEAWARKWVGLSGGSEWTAGLHFRLVLSTGARILEWKEVRVVEAVSEKGGDLRRDPAAGDASMLDFAGGPDEPNGWLYSGFHVSLRLPDGVQKVERLKIAATASVATRFKTLEIKEIPADGPGRGSGDGLEAEVRQVEPREQMSAAFTLRLRVKDVTGKELAARMPIITGVCSKMKMGVTLTVRRVEAGEVEFEGHAEPTYEGTPLAFEVDKTLTFESIRILVPDGLEERTIYTEFRNVPLK